MFTISANPKVHNYLAIFALKPLNSRYFFLQLVGLVDHVLDDHHSLCKDGVIIEMVWFLLHTSHLIVPYFCHPCSNDVFLSLTSNISTLPIIMWKFHSNVNNDLKQNAQIITVLMAYVFAETIIYYLKDEKIIFELINICKSW